MTMLSKVMSSSTISFPMSPVVTRSNFLGFVHKTLITPHTQNACQNTFYKPHSIIFYKIHLFDGVLVFSLGDVYIFVIPFKHSRQFIDKPCNSLA